MRRKIEAQRKHISFLKKKNEQEEAKLLKHNQDIELLKMENHQKEIENFSKFERLQLPVVKRKIVFKPIV